MSPQSQQIVPFKQKVANTRQLLAKYEPQMAAALPKHIKIERMMQVAMNSVAKTPKLLDCTPSSFIAAVMQSAQLGLEPDGLLGQAYLIPFKTTVVLVPGYKGLLRLARNSGEISTIQAHEVYADDHFKFHYGLNPILEHIPAPEGDISPEKIVAFYAIARLKDGGVQFEVMWRRQVDAIRDKSQAYIAAKKYNKETIWDEYYAEMGKKTVLRRVCKMLPMSIDVQRAVALDEQAEAGVKQEFETTIDILPETDEPQSGLDAFVDAAEAKAETPKAAQAEPKFGDVSHEEEDPPPPDDKDAPPEAAEPEKKAKAKGCITENQVSRMFAIASGKGFQPNEMTRVVQEQGFTVDWKKKTSDIPMTQYDRICDLFENAD